MTWGFVTCGPNESMILSGCCHSKPYYVPGGRLFVLPLVQRLDRISLNIMTLLIESSRIYTKQGVPITVTGVAQVKIEGSSQDMLQIACEQFLGKSEAEIQNVAKETLEGHQRAIMGSMTVDEIYKDRKKFSEKVFEVASSDLINMGISVVSYTIKDVKDDNGYLEALGMARTAQVKRDARMGEAEAHKDSGIREALAEETKIAGQLKNQAEIAKAKRDLQLKQAACDQEVQTMKAKSELAYQLQAAKTQQLIKNEEMQIELVERKRRIELEELEKERMKRILDATVKKPAEAERDRLKLIAGAELLKVKAEAEAESESIKLRGIAEAEASRALMAAEADKTKKMAAAYQNFNEAATLNMVLQTMPKIAAEVGGSLSELNRLTMVSTGDGDIGISKLTGELMNVIEGMPKLITSMTGQNINNLMKSK